MIEKLLKVSLILPSFTENKMISTELTERYIFLKGVEAAGKERAFLAGKLIEGEFTTEDLARLTSLDSEQQTLLSYIYDHAPVDIKKDFKALEKQQSIKEHKLI